LIALFEFIFQEFARVHTAAKLLSQGEARRIAANIAKLPELLKKPNELRRLTFL
jgi:hypothetical protein